MSSDTNRNFSCPNPLCDLNELFSDYDAVCEHLNIPSTHCSQWAIDFVDHMARVEQHSNENENDGMTLNLNNHLLPLIHVFR
jgi:hypothetical protein